MFNPHTIERADCYAEYQRIREWRRNLRIGVAATCTLASVAIIVAVLVWL